MTPSTDTEGAAPEAAALAETFTNEVNEFFGDVAPAGEPDEATPSDGSTPDAAPPTDAVDDATTVEGADGTKTPSEETTSAAAPVAVEDDPFKDTEAASYVLNGKAIPVEDIRVFKEGGAVIRPESLPNILSKLAERDTLSEKLQTRDRDYQTLSKVSEWKDDASGKTYAGPEAVVELRVRATELFAENQLMVSEILQSEDLHAAGFLTTKRIPDSTVEGGFREAVVFRPDAIARLQEKNELRNLKASSAVRAHYTGILDSAAKVAPPVDFTAAAPDLIQKVATASSLDASVLTASDKSILAKHLPFHTRNGLASLEWQDLVKDRIQDRLSQKSSTAKVVDTTTKAVKEGQARMLAAARGVKPVVAKPVPVKAPTQATERAQNQGDAWDALESASARALRSSR